MTYGFIQQSRDPKVDELMKASPEAFLLVTQIARRARRADSGLNVHNLALGEALVGDYRAIGLTEQKYRTAKAQLQKWKIATFQSTNKGTIARLCDSAIYNINSETSNEQSNGQPTGSQRAANGQPTTKNNDKNGKNGRDEADASSKKNRARGTIDELTAYAVERQLPASDGEWLYDKMLTSGWKVDGKDVKDWQALIRVWQKNGYFPSQKGGRNGQQIPTPQSAIEQSIPARPRGFHALAKGDVPQRQELPPVGNSVAADH